MCFSGCKNEYKSGESAGHCSGDINSFDMELHCNTSFECIDCGDVVDIDDMGDVDNTCFTCCEENE